MGSGVSAPNFKRRPRNEVADHMVRLQRIADFKAKPLLKDGGIVELSMTFYDMIMRMKGVNTFDSFPLLKQDLLPYKSLQSQVILVSTIGKVDVTIRERSDGKVGLDLGLKNLYKLPEEVVYNNDMQQCTWIDLSRNKLENLEGIQELMHLQEIYVGKVMEHGKIYGNGLTTFPTNVYKLPFLKILDLSGNKIKELPPSIVNLRNIEVLSIARNDVSIDKGWC